jgi:tRNA U34 5-methylaminomethyl-2-thiouridine-forming methyltransferase MnmC
MEPKRFEIYQRHGGNPSLRDSTHGEVMHPGGDPSREARELYVEQTRLEQRLATATTEPLVVWDVGLGAATNAAAVLSLARRMADEGRLARPLQLESFELYVEAPRLVLEQSMSFPWLQPTWMRHALGAVLQGEWKKDLLTWRLFDGDFLETAPRAARPHLVLYDMFSAKTFASHWNRECFARIHAMSYAHATPGMEEGTALITTSQATPVRSAMLAAGFFVAQGQASGPKRETTVATTVQAGPYQWLAARWMQRFERNPDQKSWAPDYRQAVLGHRQFL